MHIESIQKKDLNTVLKWIKKEFPYVQLTQKAFKEKHATEFIEGFKAVEHKKMKGYIELQFLKSCKKYKGKNCARINAVMVKESVRHKGIGSALLQYAIEYAKMQDVKKLILLVEEENAQGKQWYKKHEFKKHGKHDKQLNDKPVEEMVLTLN